MRGSAGMAGGGLIRATGKPPGRPPRVSTTSFATTAAGSGCSSLPCFCDVEDWESAGGLGFTPCYDNGDDDDDVGFSERYVFGSVPTREEAEEAVSTIQQIYVPITFDHVAQDGCPPLDKDATDEMMNATDKMQKGSSELESDWIEPTLHLDSSRTIQFQERARVLDAFCLLQKSTSIQKMVVSLSSDKDVWNAVMNNEAVRELKKSFYGAEGSKPQSSDERPDIPTTILRWILDNTKAKIEGLCDVVTKFVNKLFHSQEKDGRENGNNSGSFGRTLRSSFMLSTVVFIVVIVARIQKA